MLEVREIYRVWKGEAIRNKSERKKIGIPFWLLIDKNNEWGLKMNKITKLTIKRDN